MLTESEVRLYIAQNVFTSGQVLHGKDLTGNRIGIELEIFAFELDVKASLGFKPVVLNDKDAAFGEMLAAKTSPIKIIRKFALNDKGEKENKCVDTLIYPDGDQIRFEPGGQLEIITNICNTAWEVEAHLKDKQDLIKKLSDDGRFSFLQYGSNPWFTADEIDLQLHFPRYRALEKYLESISIYGRQMMFQTCSMHLNFDFGATESLRVKRYVAANLLVPFTIAMFANSAVIGNKSTGCQSYRAKIWQNLDPRRTGMANLSKVLTTWKMDDLIDAYTDFALKAPIIFIQDHPNKKVSSNFTLNDWLQNPNDGIEPTEKDFINHLTLLFPYVRPKGYLELRATDAPPTAWQMIPALFHYAIMYSDKQLNRVLEILTPMYPEMDVLLDDAVFGYKSNKIWEIALELMQCALDGSHELESEFILPRETNLLHDFANQYVDQRRTFADDSPNGKIKM